MILIIILVVIVSFLMTAGLVFAYKVTRPKQIPYDETYRIEVEKGRMDPEWFEEIEKEEIWIDSPYGYRLHGLFIPCNNSSKAVIICHGITYSLFGSIKYARIFHKLGFNVIAYDHRNHGKSGGSNTTLGYYEKHDLASVKSWVIQRLGKDVRIGLHGESMGAAIVLQYLS
ncbi:MAG: alpha/beta fold hydrolase, partial [Mesotoga sp.]|nr:alpha/beta fold hydrolase [Mesotoga sp.]